MIIMKFGGTSVKDSTAMSRAIDIVADRREQSPVVVLSACSGITDKLIYLSKYSAFEFNNDCRLAYKDIVASHITLAEELITTPKYRNYAIERVNKLLSELKKLLDGISMLRECTDKSYDSAVSYGELLSTTIFEAACNDRGLNAAFIDARKVMLTDSTFGAAKVFHDAVRSSVKLHFEPLLNDNKIIVTQGFIGADPSGRTTTLGRGGSDYSAAVFGEAAGAEEIQIWTDVPGVLTADPKKEPNARTIPMMSFAEIRELSFYGAKVLHPDTIKPAIENNIPVRVLDSSQPHLDGTLIVNRTDQSSGAIRSVIHKQKCILCRLEIPYNEDSQLYFARIIKHFSKSGIRILSSISTENNCQFIIDYNNSFPAQQFERIRNEYKVETTDMSLLCLCGSSLLYPDENVNRILTQVTELLAETKPAGFIFGASSVSVIALVPMDCGLKTLHSIHELILNS